MCDVRCRAAFAPGWAHRTAEQRRPCGAEVGGPAPVGAAGRRATIARIAGAAAEGAEHGV